MKSIQKKKDPEPKVKGHTALESATEGRLDRVHARARATSAFIFPERREPNRQKEREVKKNKKRRCTMSRAAGEER